MRASTAEQFSDGERQALLLKSADARHEPWARWYGAPWPLIYPGLYFDVPLLAYGQETEVAWRDAIGESDFFTSDDEYLRRVFPLWVLAGGAFEGRRYDACSRPHARACLAHVRLAWIALTHGYIVLYELELERARSEWLVIRMAPLMGIAGKSLLNTQSRQIWTRRPRKKKPSRDELVAHRAEYVQRRGGVTHGWLTQAARKFKLNTETLVGLCKEFGIDI